MPSDELGASTASEDGDLYVRLQDALDAARDAGADDDVLDAIDSVADDARVPCAGGCGTLLAPDTGPYVQPVCEPCVRENHNHGQ